MKGKLDGHTPCISWNVEEYKKVDESPEQWQLRKSFMLAHKARFKEDRLVCLAQTFINIEFLGCKYPNEVMLLIAELSKDIAEEFRKQRASRLKRTFVSASDAAEQRVKGTSFTKTHTKDKNKSSQFDNHSTNRCCFGDGAPIDLFEGLRFGKLVIYLIPGRECIRNSCTVAGVKYEERQCDAVAADNTKTTEILVNNEVIATGSGANIKIAKMAAFKQAVLHLQTNCYSIKMNVSRDTIKVGRSKNGIELNITKDSIDHLGEAKLDETNKGYRIMRLMGWTGGGLGRLKQGREEPVSYLLKSNRAGLGAKQLNVVDVRRLLKNYSTSDDVRDLQFDASFSKEERALFHQHSRANGLRSSSYGVGEKRSLLISKTFSYNQILQEVLIARNPVFCSRYFVQVPMTKAYLFPGHVASLDLEV